MLLGIYWGCKALYNEFHNVLPCSILFHLRKFPGHALSTDDWTDQLKQLANDIRDRRDVDTSGTYYTAGYNGPWTEASKRVNEVWIMRDNSAENSSPFTSQSSNNWSKNSGIQSSDDLTELIQHNTIERGDVSIQQF